MNFNKTYSASSISSSKNLNPIVEVSSDEDSSGEYEQVQARNGHSSHQPFGMGRTANINGSGMFKNGRQFHVTGNENSVGFEPRNRRRSAGLTDYESLCASSLSLSESEPVPNFSPIRAHVNGKWGSSSRNWSFWSSWDSSWQTFPFFSDDGPVPKFSFQLEREDLKNFINSTFEKHRLVEKGWDPIKNNNFVVLRVTQQNMGENYLPYTQEIHIDAHQLLFQKENDKGPTAYYSQSKPVKLLACAGLAEIFQAVIRNSDILVIFGGYDDTLRSDQSIPLLGVNFNKHCRTQILRIPGNLDGNIKLYEKIVPTSAEKRYKFMYTVRRGSFQRQVEQHRTFDQETFCRKVTETLAYSRARWDFPVPIVRSANVRALYDLLCDPSFEMPKTRPLSPRRIIYEHDDNDDELIHRSLGKRKSASPKKDMNDYQQRRLHKATKKRSSTKCGCVSITCVIILTTLLTAFATILGISWMSNGCPAAGTSKENLYQLLLQVGGRAPLPLNTENGNDNHNPSDVNGDLDLDIASFLSKLKVWEKRGSYTTKNMKYSVNNIYNWMAIKSRIMINWIDVALKWIGKNCNLQCVLSKMGFHVDDVL